MAIFGPRPWVNPFGKLLNFRLFELLFFYSVEMPFFSSRISQNTFSWPILPKKKSWKNCHFWSKLIVNKFGKISIFRVFELFVVVA